MAIPLRADYAAEQLRSAAKRSKGAAQARRLLALAAICDGVSRTEAAQIGVVTVQIVRDWVVNSTRRIRKSWSTASRQRSRRGFRTRTAQHWRRWSRAAPRPRSTAWCAGG